MKQILTVRINNANYVELVELQKVMKELYDEIESLKCCGNCLNDDWYYDMFECPKRSTCKFNPFGDNYDYIKEDNWEKK